MEDLLLIAVIVVIGLPFGALLFFPIRWLLLRNASDEVKKHKVSAADWVFAALIVGVILTLFSYMHTGNMMATIAFVVVVVVFKIGGILLVHRSKKDTDALDSKIVAEPIGPGLFRRCPECRKWFAMTTLLGQVELTRYVCKRCGFVLEVPRKFDPQELH